MKLSRTRAYKINMGNYESMEVSATISIEGIDIHEEDDLATMDPDEVLASLQEHAERYLDQQLDPELERAAELSAASASMLFDNPPPRQTSRREKARTR